MRDLVTHTDPYWNGALFVRNDTKGARCPQGVMAPSSPTIHVKPDNPRQAGQSTSSPTIHVKPDNPRQARQSTSSPTVTWGPAGHARPCHTHRTLLEWCSFLYATTQKVRAARRASWPRQARQSPSSPTVPVKPDNPRQARQSTSSPTIHVKPDNACKNDAYLTPMAHGMHDPLPP